MTISYGALPGSMRLYCAVDIMDGGAVRLTQGDFRRRTEHGDPVALALRFVNAGARLLHVVDLDAARGGVQMNRESVLSIVEVAGVPVQVGGGVRDYDDAVALLEGGAARVIVSTAAVEEPEMVDDLASRYPYRIALGLDHRSSKATDHRSSKATDHRSSKATDHRSGNATDHRTSERGEVTDDVVAVRGWKHRSDITVEALLERFAGTPLGAVVVTSIARDGMLTGPDFEGLEKILALSAQPVVASGGVRSVSDLSALAAVAVVSLGGEIRRIEGVVVGRALANGSLQVKEALAACERSG